MIFAQSDVLLMIHKWIVHLLEVRANVWDNILNHIWIKTNLLKDTHIATMSWGGSRGLVVKVLDSKFKGCEFNTHTGHGSFSKLRQFRLPYFASVYSAVNEYKHCLEGTCDVLVSRPGESV